MIYLPPRESKQWQQNNRSDVLGTLWSSFNLNLTEQIGRTKVSPRLYITTNGIATLGTPVGFRGFNGNIYAVAPASTPNQNGIKISMGGQTINPFASDGTAGSGATNFSNDYSDIEIYNAALFVSGSDDAVLYTKNGASWTGGNGGIISSVTSSNVNHKLLTFSKTNLLYIAATLTQIYSINTSFVANTSTGSTNTFAIKNTDLFITSTMQTSDLIWVLTTNFYNNQGYIYTWDGVTADTPSSIIPLDSRGALAGIVKDSTPFIINADAKLQYYNGGTFVDAPYGQLPIKSTKYLKNSTSQKNNRWIHPNGISLVNGKINIFVNNEYNDSTTSIQESLASGVWEYDPAIGWYHKNAVTQYDYSGAQTITDYGQNRLSRVGALYNLKPLDAGSPVGTLLVGADYFTNATTVKSATYTNDSLDLVQKYGYLVTERILAKDIQDTWSNIYMRIRPLLASTDKIWLKWRYTEDDPTEVTGTWVSANTFTTTTNVSSYVQGNEIEVLNGQGGGWCANITSVTNNSGTYTVVLEDALSFTPSGTAKIRFQTWNRGGNFNQQRLNLASFTALTNAGSPYAQFKICYLFTGDDGMIDLILDNVPIQ